VLVFFDTEATVNEFLQSPYAKSFDKVNTIVETTLDKDFYIKKATTEKQVTLLSRLFGRGLDFHCRDEAVISAGGVHVIQTFLSECFSEEVQIKGRTARQGQKGSYRLILKVTDLVGMSIKNQEIDEARKSASLYSFLNTKRVEFADAKSKERTKVVQRAQQNHDRTLKFQDKLKMYSPVDRVDALTQLMDLQSVEVSSKNPVLLHTVVVIDVSSSMSVQDAKPTKPELVQKVNNRLGAVLEALDNYVAKRVQANSADLVSVIAFNSKVTLSLEAVPVTSFKLSQLSQLVASGGTDFGPPLLHAEQLLLKHPPNHHIPFVFFLSDGGGSYQAGVVQRMKQKHTNFRLDALIFGNDLSGEANLKAIATEGGGNLLKTAASLEELDQVMGFLDKNF